MGIPRNLQWDMLTRWGPGAGSNWKLALNMFMIRLCSCTRKCQVPKPPKHDHHCCFYGWVIGSHRSRSWYVIYGQFFWGQSLVRFGFQKPGAPPARTILLILLVTACDGTWMLEQPYQTMFRWYGRFRHLTYQFRAFWLANQRTALFIYTLNSLWLGRKAQLFSRYFTIKKHVFFSADPSLPSCQPLPTMSALLRYGNAPGGWGCTEAAAPSGMSCSPTPLGSKSFP